MSRHVGLDRPKGPGYFLFWKTVFLVLLAGFMYFVYMASSAVEYVWRWERVPQYFWLKQDVDVRAESEGDLLSIKRDATGVTLTIKTNSGEVQRVMPADAEVHLSEGDFVYMGDSIASYHQSKPGVLLEGLWITLKVSFIAIIFGIVLGVLTGLCRISANPALRWSAITYIELIRGSPLLVQIFLWYFVAGTLINGVLQSIGLGVMPPLWYGVLALAIFTGAYVAEIVRAGIQSVHRGQMEAARSLGLNYSQAMRRIILPQAFRRILPPLAGQFISLVKDSSLLGVIAVRELTKATREVVSSSLQPFELWILCAVLYLVLTFTLSLLIQQLERRALR
ncbi:amino acid ABC transporter permease [Desulfovibrio subterraneus]|uniref:Putative glutamine transport system permease protein GlnP n=1 Tax=Desulfovibrio subterraneus TaxID=2718620 RepID=A0A7J0BJV3_9BACT|nr:amino acid ABC transporter permease [Desulfovibrio subterraneus]GFM33452.1 ABC transporter permease [Desulfovibrio subterraneus]